MSRGKRYSEAYKREAVAKAKASDNVSQTARELGVSTKSLHDWIRRYSEPEALNADEASASELAVRVRQLERQLAVREAQIDILKKAIAIVSPSEAKDTP